MGARDEKQLRENLASADWKLTADLVARLDAASESTPPYPYWHHRQFIERMAGRGTLQIHRHQSRRVRAHGEIPDQEAL